MPQRDRPNIILIMTDQQRFDTMGALGFPYARTPNLDRLVREGVSFTNCFVTAPSCAPSRASLFTGYYPHTTGIFRNGDRWTRSWVERLAEAGYHCVNIGKMHTQPFETPLGFHERYVVENKDRFLEGRYYFDEWDKALAARGLVKQQRELYRLRDDYTRSLGAFVWELPEDMQSDMFVGGMARWWLGHHPRETPLFLQIGFPGPHPPYDPSPRFLEQYKDVSIPLAEVTDEEIASQPEAFRILIEHNLGIDHDSISYVEHPTEAQRLRQRRHYLANVSMIDEQVGSILRCLDEEGYLDSSIVVFTSDHGDCLTDHGHSQKWTMYDAVTRVPAIVWAPGRIDGGRTCDGLCSMMDLGPTILQWAGIEVPADFEAVSLNPVLDQGVSSCCREWVFSEHARDATLTGTEFMIMVRSREWKYVYFVDSPDGQLFDLVSDPGEIRNLWNDPAYEQRRRKLHEVMTDWLIRSHHTTASWKAGNR